MTKNHAQAMFEWGHQLVFEGQPTGQTVVRFAEVWRNEGDGYQTCDRVTSTEVREELGFLANSSYPDELHKVLGSDWGPRTAQRALSRLADLEREVSELRALVQRRPLDPRSSEVREAISLLPPGKSAAEQFMAGVRYAEFRHNIRALPGL